MSADNESGYTGVLNEPIVLPNELLHTKEEQQSMIMMAQLERLSALYDHFGIKPGDEEALFCLVLELAHKHVPGFSLVGAPKKSAGRPPEYTGAAYSGLRLYALVKKQIRIGGLTSELAGVRAVIENEPEFSDFKAASKDEQKRKIKDLYERYMEVKRNGLKGNFFVEIVKSVGKNYNLDDHQIDETIEFGATLVPRRVPKRK